MDFNNLQDIGIKGWDKKNAIDIPLLFAKQRNTTLIVLIFVTDNIVQSKKLYNIQSIYIYIYLCVWFILLLLYQQILVDSYDINTHKFSGISALFSESNPLTILTSMSIL